MAITRRAWIGGAAALAAQSAQQKAARPKVGCTSWAFHSFQSGADPTEAIGILGEIGFEGTDLIVLAKPDLTSFWTPPKVDTLRKRLAEAKLAVAQFVLFQPVVEGLTSRDRAVREQNLDAFEAGCKLAKAFEAPLINIVAPWPREWKGPSDYLPRYYEIAKPKPGETFHIDIAPGFDWDEAWANYVTVTKACLQRAKAHGRKLSIEHHTHTMIPDAASFLRLWEAIKDPALGYNLDTGWTLHGREYPGVAIHKTRRQLMNVHVRDIDGTMRRFPHIGEGVMDFPGVVVALKEVGYTGYLSLEQDKHPGDMKATCKRYLELMKREIAEQYGG
ncbi:MAG: sugar phosphate isomerase/epimerase [Bryobacteraceae bacterium]|nr:sugar phosphate isomerase/epimerase [Bryobacteraceae bacterium]